MDVADRVIAACALAWLLAACATTPAGPLAGLQHGQSGPVHILIGPWPRIQDACRAIGVKEPGVIFGCWLPAGETHWIWAAEGTTLADTLAHEIRHALEGYWHPPFP